MKVHNIMTTNVSSCGPGANLAAAGLLWDYDCGSPPVFDSGRYGCAVFHRARSGVILNRNTQHWDTGTVPRAL